MFAWMCIYVPCINSAKWLGESIGSPGIGVTDFVNHHVGPLEEQAALITTEPSPQPTSLHFYHCWKVLSLAIKGRGPIMNMMDISYEKTLF